MPTVENVSNYFTNIYGSGPSDVNTYQVLKSRVIRNRSDTVRTAEHALRRRQPHIWVPPTPFTASEYRKNYPMGELERLDHSYERGVAVWSPATEEPTGVVNDNGDLQNQALIRALNNLKQQDVNYAQAFAERAQTAELVASSATKIAKMLKALKSHDFKGAAAALGVSPRHRKKKRKKSPLGPLHQAVLELDYGWKPLLSDVYGAAKDLADKDTAVPKRYVVTARGSALDHFDTGYRKILSPGNGANDTFSWNRLYLDRSTRVRLDYNIDEAYLVQLASGGFTNPAQLAWELLPWSFVADWFIPIGNYLSAFDAALGYHFLGGCASKKNLGCGYMAFMGWAGTNPTPFKTYTGRYGWFLRKDIARTVYSSSPLPKLPGFKNPFSSAHLRDAMALLSQVVS